MHWPRDGIPRNPGAWLTTTARNHALNRLRRKATEAAKLQEAAMLADADDCDEDGGGPPRRPTTADLYLLPSRPSA